MARFSTLTRPMPAGSTGCGAPISGSTAHHSGGTRLAGSGGSGGTNMVRCRTPLPWQGGKGERLALRELEAAAGLGAAVLLALDDARVTSQAAFTLDRGTQSLLEA